MTYRSIGFSILCALAIGCDDSNGLPGPKKSSNTDASMGGSSTATGGSNGGQSSGGGGQTAGGPSGTITTGGQASDSSSGAVPGGSAGQTGGATGTMVSRSGGNGGTAVKGGSSGLLIGDAGAPTGGTSGLGTGGTMSAITGGSGGLRTGGTTVALSSGAGGVNTAGTISGGSSGPSSGGSSSTCPVLTQTKSSRAARSAGFSGSYEKDYVPLYDVSCTTVAQCAAACEKAGGTSQSCAASECIHSTTDYCLPPTYWSSLDQLRIEGGTIESSARIIMVNNPYRDQLVATDFQFEIPADATIKGIKMSINRSGDTDGEVGDYEVKLVREGSSVGLDRADTSPWPTTFQYAN
jgi:hypothetical protein